MVATIYEFHRPEYCAEKLFYNAKGVGVENLTQ